MEKYAVLLPVVLAVTGLLASLLFEQFQRGLAWVQRLSPGKTQLVFLAFTALLTILRQYLPGVPLPADPTDWDVNAIHAVLSAAVGIAVHHLGHKRGATS